MKFVKSLSISILIVLPVTGFVGCTAGRPTGWAPLQTHSFTEPTETRGQRQQIATVKKNEPQTQQLTNNRPLAAPKNPMAQVSYLQTASTNESLAQRLPALLTLGPNDDFYSIVRRNSGVVLVDYYADWCGPCRKQGGILHDMESTAAQRGALIVKVNVDHHPELADKFDVSSLPTLMLIKDGKIIDRQTGIADHQKVASFLSR